MRNFLALALVSLLGATVAKPALGCGDSGEVGDFDDVISVPQDRTSLTLAEARELDAQARDADREASSANRRALRLTQQARTLQQRAFQREGVQLVSLLERARTMALEASQMKRHAAHQRRLASTLRARARVLRREVAVQPTWRRVRRAPVAFER
jgi:hypothetical protein